MRTKSSTFVILFAAMIIISSSPSMVAQDKKPDDPAATTEKVEEEDSSKKETTINKNIYISGNMLYIKTSSVNDFIFVYNESGLCIDKFVKETELVVKDISAYPDGELIITNGKDLTVKVIK